MTEGITPLEELRRLNRALMEKVLDRAASDPRWKQQLLDDPDAALREAGFAEVGRIEEVRQSVGIPHEAEVSGQARANTDQHICCGSYSFTWSCWTDC